MPREKDIESKKENERKLRDKRLSEGEDRGLNNQLLDKG